jgi:hypothetical protein
VSISVRQQLRHNAMQRINGIGIIKGRTPTTLSPQGTATRAEAAAILQRFITQFMEV